MPPSDNLAVIDASPANLLLKARVAVLDDDADFCKLVRASLRGDFSVTLIENHHQLIALIDSRSVDVILLDIGLPEQDGISIAKQIRATSDIPLIFLSGYSSEDMVAKGLNIGGDDYVTKPFQKKVLLARIRNALRRKEEKTTLPASNIQLGNVVFYFRERTLTGVDSRTIALTETEALILLVLAQAESQVVSRGELFRRIHGREWDRMSRKLDVHASHLRRKLGEICGSTNPLISIRGIGYCLNLSPA